MPALHTSVGSGENPGAKGDDASRAGHRPVPAHSNGQQRSPNTSQTSGILHRLIGERLIDIYEEALHEPVPLRFKVLLRALVAPR